MKNLSGRWVAAALIAPVLMVVAMIVMTGAPPEAASTGTGKGTVEIAFIAPTITNGTAFQRILLNVVAVRVNPSTDKNVSEFDTKWRTIPAPAGVGSTNPLGTLSTNQNFGGNFGPNGNVVGIGQGRSEVQIELNRMRTQAVVMNSASIRVGTYHVIELVLDSQNPGTLVPLCGGSTPRGEGCKDYTAQFAPAFSGMIRFFSSGGFDLSSKALVPLVLTIDPGPLAPPVTSKDPILIAPTIAMATFSPLPPAITGLGQITGKVTGAATSNQMVIAELTGTNQIIASFVTDSSGNYTFALPASTAGTLYDLYTSVRQRSIAVKSSVTVTAGQSTTVNFTVSKKGPQAVTGKVLDACNGNPVQAATLKLFLPDPAIAPAGGCAVTPPSENPPVGCVEVATAQTDETGTYPLPGSAKVPAAFSMIPTGSTYTMTIDASGYNPGTLTVKTVSTVLKCPASGFANNACSVSLERGEFGTSVTLSSPNTTGAPINVLIMAEDTGTNKLESLALATVPAGAAESAPISVLVPDNAAPLNPVAAFDLFATVQDTFAGVPDVNSGHVIEVQSDVTGSPKCPASPVMIPAFSGFACAGHGSGTGTITSFDENTLVLLASHGVDLMQIPVGPPGAENAGTFNFCAPAGSGAGYTIQKAEASTEPGGQPNPVGAPAGIALAVPVTIPTPCNGICGSTSTTCLLCTGTNSLNLP